MSAGPFSLPAEPSNLHPRQNIAASLRLLADELEQGTIDIALVVLSEPNVPLPSVRIFGRPNVRWAEVDGLLLQAAMLPPC